MTYELLQDRESGLYAELPEFVCSLVKDEENGFVLLLLQNGYD